jgi:hypothetical protein
MALRFIKNFAKMKRIFILIGLIALINILLSSIGCQPKDISQKAIPISVFHSDSILYGRDISKFPKRITYYISKDTLIEFNY